MSRDWFDPLGIRGSRLDPVKFFTDALKGEGLTQQSAERVATGVAQSLVGRRVEVDREPPMAATVHAVQELSPATGLAAMAVPDGRVPMWQRFRATLGEVTIGRARVTRIDFDAVDLAMTAPVGGRLQVQRVDAVGRLTAVQIDEWVAELEMPYVVRLRDGHLEASDPRVERWVGVSISVTAADQRVRIETGMIRVFGRWFRAPARLRRVVERDAPWLPAGAEVKEVRVEDDALHVAASMERAELPVDVAKLLTDLGTESTRSVLRIVTGW